MLFPLPKMQVCGGALGLSDDQNGAGEVFGEAANNGRWELFVLAAQDKQAVF